MDNKEIGEIEEKQALLEEIWCHFIQQDKKETTDEEAQKIFNEGLKFLDVVAKIAIEEQMLGDKESGCSSSFERNLLNSISELLETFHNDVHFYSAWRKSIHQMGRVDLELTRED